LECARHDGNHRRRRHCRFSRMNRRIVLAERPHGTATLASFQGVTA
jgi:hypothetical protein